MPDRGPPAAVPCPPLANRFSYFLRRERNLHDWSLTSGVLESPEPLDEDALEAAVRALLARHDGLRLQARPIAGGIEQFVVDESAVRPVLMTSEVRARDPLAVRRAIEHTVREVRAGLGFPGDLLKLLHFRVRGGRSCLCLVAHHLLVDAHAFHVVLDDLDTLYRGLATGGAGEPLAPPTAPFLAYSVQTTAYWSRHAAAEAARWDSLPWTDVEPLPVPAGLDDGAHTERHTFRCVESLPMRALHRDGARAPRRFVECLLAAVARAFRRWTGHEALLLANTFHGRVCVRERLDASRTVGWLSETVPLVLRPGLDEAELLEDTRAQLERATVAGKSFGVLRHLLPESPSVLAVRGLPEPQVSLNVRPPVLPRAGTGTLGRRAGGYSLDPRGSGSTRRVFLLSGGAWLRDGQFHLAWDFSDRIFARTTIHDFTRDCLAELVRVSQGESS